MCLVTKGNGIHFHIWSQLSLSILLLRLNNHSLNCYPLALSGQMKALLIFKCFVFGALWKTDSLFSFHFFFEIHSLPTELLFLSFTFRNCKCTHQLFTLTVSGLFIFINNVQHWNKVNWNPNEKKNQPKFYVAMPMSISFVEHFHIIIWPFLSVVWLGRIPFILFAFHSFYFDWLLTVSCQKVFLYYFRWTLIDAARSAKLGRKATALFEITT